MTASIIVIGDEILLGQVTDTNSGEIARALTPLGFEITQTRVIGDNYDAITNAVNDALKTNSLVITTGGLGPTKDDITKHVLCDIFCCPMVYDADTAANVERVFAARGLELNDLTRQQAMVPEACRVIRNLYGTAPVMWFERDGKVLVSLPGVPFEMRGMLHDVLTDEIRRHFTPDTTYLHHTLILTGITESDLAEHLDDYERTIAPEMHLAYLPVPGYIRLRLDGACPAEHDHSKYNAALDILRSLVQPWLIHDGDASPARILLERLRRHGYTVSSAESCTGGNIAHSITSVPGSSDSFWGAVVSYDNSVKINVLGVDTDTLKANGAVSEPVVRQMAEGVAARLGTDCSMATSGVAGPGGGTPDKPVGTVWMAIHVPGRTETWCQHFAGDRMRVIDRATNAAILRLAATLQDD